jgi:hypothetical protein
MCGVVICHNKYDVRTLSLAFYLAGSDRGGNSLITGRLRPLQSQQFLEIVFLFAYSLPDSFLAFAYKEFTSSYR